MTDLFEHSHESGRAPEYAAIGPWWTFDAPSLRVADSRGRYVSVWSTGTGPSLALFGDEPASHGRWDELAPFLGAWFTVHAIETESDAGFEPAQMRLAVEAVGAKYILAERSAARALMAMTSSPRISKAVVLGSGRMDITNRPDVLHLDGVELCSEELARAVAATLGLVAAQSAVPRK